MHAKHKIFKSRSELCTVIDTVKSSSHYGLVTKIVYLE